MTAIEWLKEQREKLASSDVDGLLAIDVALRGLRAHDDALESAQRAIQTADALRDQILNLESNRDDMLTQARAEVETAREAQKRAEASLATVRTKEGWIVTPEHAEARKELERVKVGRDAFQASVKRLEIAGARVAKERNELEAALRQTTTELHEKIAKVDLLEKSSAVRQADFDQLADAAWDILNDMERSATEQPLSSANDLPYIKIHVDRLTKLREAVE